MLGKGREKDGKRRGKGGEQEGNGRGTGGDGGSCGRVEPKTQTHIGKTKNGIYKSKLVWIESTVLAEPWPLSTAKRSWKNMSCNW